MTKNENCVSSDTRVLITVMAKVPAPGAVKTRLAPLLSATQSAQIAAAFLEDTLQNCQRITPNILLAYAPRAGEKQLREILSAPLRSLENLWLAQEGENLGARLEYVAARGFELGFSPVIIIGADSPTLPPHFLQNAINELATENCDIVLGPTNDGGFYLLGMNTMQRNLYRNVAWSTPSVLKQVGANAENLNLSVRFLDVWRDVDTPEDLRMLHSDLQKNGSARDYAPRTTAWLQEYSFLFDT